jgi:hypothetical protein
VLHGLDYYTGGAQPPGGVNSTLKTTNKALPIATLFSLGGGYEFIQGWKLIGRYGETTVSSSGMNVVPGTNLKEQHQVKAEIGIQGQVNSWFNPSVNYFHRDAQNELNLYGYNYVSAGRAPGQTALTNPAVAGGGFQQSCGTPSSSGASPLRAGGILGANQIYDPCYNQSNTVRDGFEVTSTGQIGSNTNYNFGWTSYTKLNSAALGTTARNQVNMSFGHRFDVLGENFNLTGAFKYLPKYKGSQSDLGAWSGGYTRYDFGLGHDFKLAQLPLTATVYGQNLTDERFETNSGVQDVGRVVGIEFISSF